MHINHLVGLSLLSDVSVCFPLVNLSKEEEYDDDEEEGEEIQEQVGLDGSCS